MNFWEEAVKKAVNAEVKTLLQPLLSNRKIDTKCLREYRPAKKEEKNAGRTKSTDSPLVNMPSEKFIY